MIIQFAGAAQTVTGSQTLLRQGQFVVMVDCGLFQGPKSLREQNWNPAPHLREVDAIVLTHAHIDHSGLLPRWAHWGWKGRVYCTPATAALLKIMLPDAARLQEEDARFANKTQYSRHQPALPLYTVEDAEKALSFLYPVDYLEWTSLHSTMSFRFLRAAHILGSASVQFEYESGTQKKKIVFSGDLGSDQSEILRESHPVTEADDVVIESTYGDREVVNSDRKSALEEVVKKVIHRGGTLVIPAFAVGRTQDLLLCFYRLFQESRIPKVPVYLDSPMAQMVTEVYGSFDQELKGREILEALNSDFFKMVGSPEDSMLLSMSTDSKIVISASGMLQGGRVMHHLKRVLPDEKSGVLFVGYQGQETKGHLLKKGIQSLRIHHQEFNVEAEIFSIEGFSAHADQSQLIAWVDRFDPRPQRIFLNHGEAEAQKVLKEKLESKGYHVVIPKFGESQKLV